MQSSVVHFAENIISSKSKWIFGTIRPRDLEKPGLHPYDLPNGRHLSLHHLRSVHNFLRINAFRSKSGFFHVSQSKQQKRSVSIQSINILIQFDKGISWMKLIRSEQKKRKKPKPKCFTIENKFVYFLLCHKKKKHWFPFHSKNIKLFIHQIYHWTWIIIRFIYRIHTKQSIKKTTKL